MTYSTKTTATRSICFAE